MLINEISSKCLTSPIINRLCINRNNVAVNHNASITKRTCAPSFIKVRRNLLD